MRPIPSIVAAGLLAGLILPGSAHAARSAKKGSASRASALLAEGRRLMAAHNFAEACPKIADSQSQQPSPATAMTLASCYQKEGKLATAWATYRAAADSATSPRTKKLAREATRMSVALERKVSRLTIKVEDASGVEVLCDGDAVQQSDFGTPVPRDGGGHDVEARAAGKKTWKKHVELADSGQTLEVDVPRLEDDVPEAAASTEASDTDSTASAASPGAPPGKTQRIAAFAVGGAGVAALVLGAYAGIHANSTYNDAIAACGGSTSCASGGGLSLRSSASSWATVSTVSFVVAGAALASGVALFLLAPHNHDAQAPAVGIAPSSLGTGLSCVGRF